MANAVKGRCDPFLPPHVARRLHEAIPGSSLDIIPDVRHFIPEEAPESISTIIEGWLKR